MPLFKDFRRRSKASSASATTSAAADPSPRTPFSSNGIRHAESFSTLDSSSQSLCNTSPLSTTHNASSPHLQTLSKLNGNGCGLQITPPQRPVPIGSQSSRSSGTGGNGVSPTNMRAPPTSPYAPRVLSISDNSWVHQKVLLVYGQIGDLRQPAFDGTLTISHTSDSFPPISWPVHRSIFKALVHLVPGPNKLRLDFTSSKIPNPTAHMSWISINYLPLVNSPPLQLAIIMGSDSDGRFDAVPERASREGNDLKVAIRKFRMAAYLWQSFTAEQMFRNVFGRRCFRFEEEWQPGTLSCRDNNAVQMRNEAKIHIIRCDRTVAELRGLSGAQQNGANSNNNELFDVALDAVKRYFGTRKGQTQYVSALILDSHWDKDTKTITGHTAAGSTNDDIKLALFGSYALQSYPSCLEDVVPAFTDCTRTDTNFIANDNNECGSYWEAANSGIGGHLREIGHMFGCTQQDSGIMGRDYLHLGRTFIVREPYSTRTKSLGSWHCHHSEESSWHRLDALRFRFHPCFRLPSDIPLGSDDSIQVYPVDNGTLLASSPAGIAFIEIFVENSEICKGVLELLNGDTGSINVPKQVAFTESELRQCLPDNTKKNKITKLVLHSGSLSTHTVQDFGKLKSKQSIVKLPNGQIGYRGSKLGQYEPSESRLEEVLLECAFIQTKLLVSIKVYHDQCIYGLEFCYEDSTSQVFGNQNVGSKCDEFVFDTRRGEILMGFHVKAGLEISGIEILTSLGRKSGIFGNGVETTG
ncbi:hypothetical protein FQN53_002879 [Emmonsiellopsis sp. PD_33]|nr:hypothetical protein FQN53_002879 [Emmonsiellopsis sp. PD_33]